MRECESARRLSSLRAWSECGSPHRPSPTPSRHGGNITRWRWMGSLARKTLCASIWPGSPRRGPEWQSRMGPPRTHFMLVTSASSSFLLLSPLSSLKTSLHARAPLMPPALFPSEEAYDELRNQPLFPSQSATTGGCALHTHTKL